MGYKRTTFHLLHSIIINGTYRDPSLVYNNPFYVQIPDVAAELSHGCYGFAAAYMQWPEQLIVGGATRNSTSALRSAKALQTVVQLMGEREMYEYWADHYKVHHVGWTQEKAAAVLDSWQRKFAAVSYQFLF